MSEAAVLTQEAPVAEAPPAEVDGLNEAVARVFGQTEGATEAPAKEAPAEAEAPKEDPRISAKLNASIRYERKLAAQRAEMAQLESAKQQMAPVLRMLEQVNAEFGSPEKFAEALAFAKSARGAKGSPTELLRLAEQEPKDFLESLANEHEPAVLIQRMQSRFQEQLDAVRGDFEKKLAAERSAHEQKAAAQNLQQQTQAAQQAFVDHVAENAEKYPHLVEEFSPDEIAERALQTANLHSAAYRSRYGEPPTDEVIADYLEEQAKARAESRTAWRQRIGKAAGVPGTGLPTSEKNVRPVGANVPRTTSSRGASQNHTSPAREMTQEERDVESLRILNSYIGKKTG